MSRDWPYPDVYPTEYERRSVARRREQQKSDAAFSNGMMIIGLMALAHIVVLAWIC